MYKTINKVQSEALARIVAHNMVERFGIVVDANGDGEISVSEIEMLASDGRHSGNSLSAITLRLAKKAQDMAISASEEAMAIEQGFRGGGGGIINNLSSSFRKSSKSSLGLGGS
jgi:hypothetical protein